MHPDHESTPKFRSHHVVCTHLTVSFRHNFVHGCGAKRKTKNDEIHVLGVDISLVTTRDVVSFACATPDSFQIKSRVCLFLVDTV